MKILYNFKIIDKITNKEKYDKNNTDHLKKNTLFNCHIGHKKLLYAILDFFEKLILL